MKGININDKEQNFTALILEGIKTVETRRPFKGTARGPLDCLIGKRVAVISTGIGKAIVKGFVTISGKKIYSTIEEFKNSFSEHFVPESSSYMSTGTKVGYILSDPERIEPVPVPSDCRGIVIRNIPDNIIKA